MCVKFLFVESLFPCDLMTFFSVVFVLFLFILCVFCRFGFEVHHEVLLEWATYKLSDGAQGLPRCCAKLLQSCSTATPWTLAHPAPLSMGFSRQVYWSGLPFPSSGKNLLANTGRHKRCGVWFLGWKDPLKVFLPVESHD